MSHWLDDAARGLSEGRFTRRAVLRRGGAVAGGALLASVTGPMRPLTRASAAAPPGVPCPDFNKPCFSPDVCCGGVSCCTPEKTCCGRECLRSGEECCHGLHPYHPKFERCCPRKPGGPPPHSCFNDEPCCGADCCSKGEQCCNSGKLAYCAPKGKCCPEGQHRVTCGGRAKSMCCPEGEYCCGGTCCKPSNCHNGKCARYTCGVNGQTGTCPPGQQCYDYIDGTSGFCCAGGTPGPLRCCSHGHNGFLCPLPYSCSPTGVCRGGPDSGGCVDTSTNTCLCPGGGTPNPCFCCGQPDCASAPGCR